MEYNKDGRRVKSDIYELDSILQNNSIDDLKIKATSTHLWDEFGSRIEYTFQEYDQESQLLEESYQKVIFGYNSNKDLIKRTTLDSNGCSGIVNLAT